MSGLKYGGIKAHSRLLVDTSLWNSAVNGGTALDTPVIGKQSFTACKDTLEYTGIYSGAKPRGYCRFRWVLAVFSRLLSFICMPYHVCCALYVTSSGTRYAAYIEKYVGYCSEERKKLLLEAFSTRSGGIRKHAVLQALTSWWLV